MKGRGTKKSKHLNYVKNTRSDVENVAIIEKKRKAICLYANQGHLSTKVTSLIDFIDGLVVQCDVPVVKKILL